MGYNNISTAAPLFLALVVPVNVAKGRYKRMLFHRFRTLEGINEDKDELLVGM